MVLRLLILKHVRNWSYEVLEREVRANLVYRDFTRVGGGKMPDAKTMGRWGLAVGPQVIKQVHERLVEIAQDQGIATGRRMRVDTTVVETNIHYPTDSSLLGDGVRVLTRTMKKISRDRGRGRREIARPQPQRETARARHCAGGARQGPAEPGEAEAEPTASCSPRPAGWSDKRSGSPRRSPRASSDRRDIVAAAGTEGLRQQLDEMVPRVQQVMKQARARVFRGDTRAEGQASQPVRAIDGSHPQGQGRQAQRVRQDGQAAGGGKPDRDRL